VECTENGACNHGVAPIFPAILAGKILSLPGVRQGKHQTDALDDEK
jgi:hypothetical protein